MRCSQRVSIGWIPKVESTFGFDALAALDGGNERLFQGPRPARTVVSAHRDEGRPETVHFAGMAQRHCPESGGCPRVTFHQRRPHAPRRTPMHFGSPRPASASLSRRSRSRASFGHGRGIVQGGTTVWCPRAVTEVSSCAFAVTVKLAATAGVGGRVAAPGRLVQVLAYVIRPSSRKVPAGVR